jgi:hypothetical protein
MDEEIRRKMEEIKGQMECLKDFMCIENNFENLCKAQDFGVNGFVYCLEDNLPCNFALSFGFKRICQCPLRVFIAKDIGK